MLFQSDGSIGFGDRIFTLMQIPTTISQNVLNAPIWSLHTCDYTAARNDIQPPLTLQSVSERTVLTAVHGVASGSRKVLLSPVYRRDASLRSCLQMAGWAVLQSSCTSTLQHSAVVVTYPAHLQFLIPSRQLTSAVSQTRFTFGQAISS